MDMLWRLMTAIFLIAAGLGFIAVGWVLSGGMFREVVTVLMAYAGLFLIPLGIVKGFLVIFAYHKDRKEE